MADKNKFSQVRRSQPRKLTQNASQSELYAELQVKSEQVDKLSCQLIDQEQEMQALREAKA